MLEEMGLCFCFAIFRVVSRGDDFEVGRSRNKRPVIGCKILRPVIGWRKELESGHTSREETAVGVLTGFYI